MIVTQEVQGQKMVIFQNDFSYLFISIGQIVDSKSDIGKVGIHFYFLQFNSEARVMMLLK